MMEPGYPAARTVAPKVRLHFERHLAAAGIDLQRDGHTTLPDEDAIEAIIDAAFWASLRREEGYVPKVSLALLPPGQAVHPVVFERSLPLDPRALVRVAPAVERPGVHLGVWRDHASGELRVWGTTRTITAYCFVLEVAAPGLLVVKHHRTESSKFVNVAVLEGDQIKIIDEDASSLPDCPELLTSLLGFDTQGTSILVQLAVSMRAHSRGGILLMVPSDSDLWRESIVQPISYASVPPYAELAALASHTPRANDDIGHRLWQDALNDAIQAVAGLTAVDGATIITDRYELLAFGAKITRRKGYPIVEQVAVTEPIEGAEQAIDHPTRLGGTRHLSSAQFVQDQRDALALVASVDGRFTIFAWSPCEKIVHAHRVETLLL
jgi:hypothetical protein